MGQELLLRLYITSETGTWVNRLSEGCVMHDTTADCRAWPNARDWMAFSAIVIAILGAMIILVVDLVRVVEVV